MQEKIKEMYGQGFSARKISHDLGVAFEEIQAIIKNNQLQITQETFNDTKISEIIELYKNGVGAKTLGNKYGIDTRRILKFVKSAGILRSNQSSKRFNALNDNVFDRIDTIEQCYWVAYLNSAAYNFEDKGRITLTFKKDHKNHLIKLINFLGGDINSIKNNNISYSYVINSKHLSKQLNKFNLNYISKLVPNLQYHFLRGIFDRSGNLTFNTRKNEWILTLAIEENLCKDIFQRDNIIFNYIDGKAIILNDNIEKLLKNLYKNATIYLDANFDKWQEFKKINLAPSIFSKNIMINNIEMNNNFFKSQTDQQIEALIPNIANHIFDTGLIFPDDREKVIREYKSLCDIELDLSQISLNNHDKIGTYICKYFCKSFYNSCTNENSTSVISAFLDKEKIEKAVRYKLADKKSSLNLNPSVIISELKNSRQIAHVSIFKPTIAKYMALKYSEVGDTIGDYACGFGGRLLGAMSCGRKYIGTDPLTTLELEEMIKFFNFKDAKLINLGSEYYKGEENGVDLYWSSPPYYELERYSSSLNQAYAKGEDYFYNKYWRNTLENVKYMLKPDKWFGVNVNDPHFKMVEIAKEYFGEIIEEITLLSTRYHFKGAKMKQEKIYMFKNVK